MFRIPILVLALSTRECENALEKFKSESVQDMNEADIVIARLRLIPFYHHHYEVRSTKLGTDCRTIRDVIYTTRRIRIISLHREKTEMRQKEEWRDWYIRPPSPGRHWSDPRYSYERPDVRRRDRT